MTNVLVPVLISLISEGAGPPIFDECFSSRAHFCCRCRFIPDTPLGQPPIFISPVQRICSRSSISWCLCNEYTFSLPWARKRCACAAILNSPHRLIIAAQGAAIMTRHDCWCECSFGIQDFVITPHAPEQGGSIRCSLSSDYEPMRAVQNRFTGTTHSGPG